eukprot:1178859-Alexandrium_andersonii.AAC.1
MDVIRAMPRCAQHCQGPATMSFRAARFCAPLRCFGSLFVAQFMGRNTRRVCLLYTSPSPRD